MDGHCLADSDLAFSSQLAVVAFQLPLRVGTSSQLALLRASVFVPLLFCVRAALPFVV